MQIINVTPHDIQFVRPDGTEFTVPPCGITLTAERRERVVEERVSEWATCRICGERFTPGHQGQWYGPDTHCGDYDSVQYDEPITFVRTEFAASPEALERLAELEAANPSAVIVDSIIGAQTFPGRVFGLMPAAGSERVPVAEKRMRSDTFVTFAEAAVTANA